MAGLSIKRRRKAWFKGVAYGVTGRGKCMLTVAKLREIFGRGLAYGRANPNLPAVRAIVDQERRRRGIRDVSIPRVRPRARSNGW